MNLRHLVWLLLLLAPMARGQERRTPPDPSLETPRRAAVAAGLDYLARHQNVDGSFGEMRKGGIGITALCLLAFMAQGHQEGRGRYGRDPHDVIRKGVGFLLKHSLPIEREVNLPGHGRMGFAGNGKPAGYIYLDIDEDSRMHGHGYATQVLVLAFGSGRARETRHRELHRKINQAIQVIEYSQTITGGWGYEPRPSAQHEGSVTVTVVQALRLAANAGFVVNREVHQRGLGYLRESQKKDGSFKYSTMSDWSSPALTAAALTAMHGFGEYYSKSITKGLEYLEDRYRNPHRIQWPFYAHYYAAQVFYRSAGRHWRFWNQAGVPFVLGNQKRGGYWDDKLQSSSRRGSHGRLYATAFSCLTLSVPDGYLPLFQR